MPFHVETKRKSQDDHIVDPYIYLCLRIYSFTYVTVAELKELVISTLRHVVQ